MGHIAKSFTALSTSECIQQLVVALKYSLNEQIIVILLDLKVLRKKKTIFKD